MGRIGGQPQCCRRPRESGDPYSRVGGCGSPLARGRQYMNRIRYYALARPPASLLQLALAGGVFAVLPHQPLAVLGDELGDQRNRVLPVIVEGDWPGDGVVIDDLAQGVGHLLAVWPDLFDLVEDELHGDEGEGAVGFRRLLVAGLVVLLLELFPARQLLDRRTFDEAERAFRERPQSLDVGVRLDA